MAVQAGIGLSRILILAGAGYTGTILLKNGKLSDLLGEFQLLVKGLEKTGEQLDGDSDYSDAVAQQVRRLAMEVRQLASARQITVLNGDSCQMGNITGFIIPAASLGALGYGYMWWKGLKFSDLLYVTKRSMATAVSNLTKHLEQVSEALSAAKTHLTQRIQLLDDKMDSQKEISKAIQEDVNVVSQNISKIGSDLSLLKGLVYDLDGRMDTLEVKQNFANAGVQYLVHFVSGKKIEMPKPLEDQLNTFGRTHSLTYSEVPTLPGLKELAENLSHTISEPAPDAVLQDGVDNVQDQPQTPHSDQTRTLFRFNSAKS